MKIRKLIIVALFVFLLLFAFGCAESADDAGEGKDEQTESVEDEYSPEVVDDLSEDFDDMRW